MLKNFLIVITLSMLCSCTRHYIPKTGDLVFQDIDCGELCDAIEKVTQGVDGTHLSHVGIISVENDTAFVYEAIGPGVIKTKFVKFLDRSKDIQGKPKVLAGRINKKYDYCIDSAIQLCRKLLNKPYDDAFDLDNQSYYCSELVYYAFKDSSGHKLFNAEPMTFKDPETGITFKA